MKHARASAYENFPGPQETARFAPAGRQCAWEGCANAGEYRAPKDRKLADYILLCLDHVRAYNAKWNFHAGLSPTEMEEEIRRSTTWERPTWKLGTLGAGARGGRPPHVHDPFGFAAGTDFDTKAKQRRQEKAEEAATPGGAPARTQALRVLDLTAPITMETLKRRYKALVKQHHPDANGGSAEAETRMKIINAAYHTLRAALLAQG